MCVAHLTNLQQQSDILVLSLERWNFFLLGSSRARNLYTLLPLQKRDELYEILIEDSTKAGRFVLFFWGPFVEGLA